MNVNLKQTYYSATDGLIPVTVSGKRLNARTSELVSFSLTSIRELYRAKSGFYWLHVMVSGIGHYIAPLTEKEAKLRIYMIKNGGIS